MSCVQISAASPDLGDCKASPATLNVRHKAAEPCKLPKMLWRLHNPQPVQIPGVQGSALGVSGVGGFTPGH